VAEGSSLGAPTVDGDSAILGRRLRDEEGDAGEDSAFVDGCCI
jgi:hypothetical protein